MADYPQGQGKERGEGEGRRQVGFCAWLGHFLGCRPPDAALREHRVGSRRLHLANERTFLAWLRTALGLMAFGFVVQRFNLFVRQLELLTSGRTSGAPLIITPRHHLGSALMFLGSALGLVAAVRFLVVEHEIDTDTYRPSVAFNVSLALVVAALGIFLALSFWEHF